MHSLLWPRILLKLSLVLLGIYEMKITEYNIFIFFKRNFSLTFLSSEAKMRDLGLNSFRNMELSKVMEWILAKTKDSLKASLQVSIDS